MDFPTGINSLITNNKSLSMGVPQWIEYPIARPVREASAASLVGAHVSLEELERAHILQVLESVGGHKKRAADILEINPSTLYRKLLRYGVNTPQEDEEDGQEAAGAAAAACAPEVGAEVPEEEPVLVGPDGETMADE